PVVHRQTPSLHVGELLLTLPTLTKPVPERNAGLRRRVPAREVPEAAPPLGLPALGTSRGEIGGVREEWGRFSVSAGQVPGAHPADDPGGIGHDDHVVTESGEGARADPAGVPA